MFDGVPDQFHQFLAPRTSIPLHLSFPLHASATSNPFDPYLPVLQPNLLHPLHHHSPFHKDEEKEQNNGGVSMNLQIQSERQLTDPCWTNDEVLALLRIRSSMESCFPDLTWEHVSRKLAELGFKRSAEKCKEKFEEESRYLNNINYNENYRFLSELEELYQGDQNPEVGTEKTQHMEKPSEGQDKTGHALEEGSRHDKSATKQCVVEKSKGRKRKRQNHKFELLKGFCEKMVNKMMAQQEEMHNKLLEDILKRDEEKFAREEAWNKQEMDRMNKELEMMVQEQAVAGDRQATVIEFLKKFAANSPINQSFGSVISEDNVKVTNSSNPNTHTSSPLLHSQNPNVSSDINGENNLEPPSCSTMMINHHDTALPITCPSTVLAAQNPSSSLAHDTLEVPSSSTSALASQNPSSQKANSISTCKASSNPTTSGKGDVGRRWPRDEVLALINLRCSLNNNNEGKDGNKAPLWERISQGMSESGYKRSAKRCKEKWENINKYFRKTKDINKKRSLDSRTCPYFHQLSTLYSQGKLVPQSDQRPEYQMRSPENHPQKPPEAQVESSQVGSSAGPFSIHVDGGEKTMMQVPSLDLDHQF